MTPEEGMALVAVLAAAHDDFVVTPARLQIYASALSDIPPDVGAQAVAAWTLSERRHPTIADLRAACEAAAGRAAPDLDQAWDEVGRALRAGQAPNQWSHVAVGQAVKAIGFDTMRRSENQMADRAHFEKAYTAARKRTADPGRHELAIAMVPAIKEIMTLDPKAEIAEPRRTRALGRGAR